MAGETTNTFQVTQALTANQQDVNPISTWVGRVVPVGVTVLVTMLVNATTAGVRLQVMSSTRSIQPKSQVQGGGTAGTMPSPLNTSSIQFLAYSGEEIQPLLYETLGGTPSVNVVISWEVVG